MPKNIKQQRRGKKGRRYSPPSHRYKGKVEYPQPGKELEGSIIDLKNDPGRTAPLMEVKTEKGVLLLPAPEGVRVSQKIKIGNREAEVGNILSLKDIPEGSEIFNIEIRPGDGGKIARAGGTVGRVLAHEEGGVVVKLPSKGKGVFNPKCRATIGRVAGGGRIEKPLLKAGKKHHKVRSRATLWPKTSASAMNPVDHPLGGGRGKGRPLTSKRNAPPGQKVGSVSAKRTGKKKGR